MFNNKPAIRAVSKLYFIIQLEFNKGKENGWLIFQKGLVDVKAAYFIHAHLYLNKSEIFGNRNQIRVYGCLIRRICKYTNLI